VGRHGGDVVVVKEYAARVGVVEARDAAQQCGLAAAAGPSRVKKLPSSTTRLRSCRTACPSNRLLMRSTVIRVMNKGATSLQVSCRGGDPAA